MRAFEEIMEMPISTVQIDGIPETETPEFDNVTFAYLVRRKAPVLHISFTSWEKHSLSAQGKSTLVSDSQFYDVARKNKGRWCRRPRLPSPNHSVRRLDLFTKACFFTGTHELRQEYASHGDLPAVDVAQAKELYRKSKKVSQHSEGGSNLSRWSETTLVGARAVIGVRISISLMILSGLGLPVQMLCRQRKVTQDAT